MNDPVQTQTIPNTPPSAPPLVESEVAPASHDHHESAPTVHEASPSIEEIAPPQEEAAIDEPVDEPSATAEPSEAVVSPEKATEEASLPVEPAAAESNKHWYVIKVQSGREESIKEAIERRVKIEALEDYFGQIVIPVERVTELRKGKRKTKEHKLYPGYLMAEVEFNDRILYLFRETSGVGDFVGASAIRPPQPMSPREVERMLGQPSDHTDKKVTEIKPTFDKGDRLRVKDGIFSGMEGEVIEIIDAKGAVKLQLHIFGRPTSVELEYWQVETV